MVVELLPLVEIYTPIKTETIKERKVIGVSFFKNIEMVEKNYEPICHATIDRLLRRTPVRFYRLSSKPQSGLQAFDLSRITTLKFIMPRDEKLEYLLFADLTIMR